MKKCWILLFFLVFSTVGFNVSAFDKEFGKLDFPESGYSDALAASFVVISTVGTGYGVVPFEDDDGNVSYQWGLGSYELVGSGFVIVGGYVVTAAHVVVPDRVIIQAGPYFYYEVTMRILKSRIISVAQQRMVGAELEIVYCDTDADTALLKFVHSQVSFRGSSIRIARTLVAVAFGYYSLITPGDVVAVIVHQRDNEGNMGWKYELRVGVVRDHRVSVPAGWEDIIPFFSMSDFTLDLDVRPGDSGSPVIAFDKGVPVFVGIIRAGFRGPNQEKWVYAARLDSLYPVIMASK